MISQLPEKTCLSKCIGSRRTCWRIPPRVEHDLENVRLVENRKVPFIFINDNRPPIFLVLSKVAMSPCRDAVISFTEPARPRAGEGVFPGQTYTIAREEFKAAITMRVNFSREFPEFFREGF